jgi:cell division transport system ATP-binding protein
VENPISISQATIHQGNIAVLQNVNLQVSEGEFVYLIGRTGSGKSSLLKTLYGELKLQEGRIDIAGYDLDNLMFVLSATGWKNKHEMLDRCKAVLEKVGLQTKDYKIPAELSGGEQQRLVIARALLNDPKVMLADEPTGNLDPEVSDEIMMLLKNIAREGTAILMATHDYRLIQKFGGTVCKLEDRTLNQVDSFQIS